jgi:AmiR/NasT family two-component response regulator
LRVPLIDPDPKRAAVLEVGLRDSGCRIVAVATPDDDIVERVRADAPDVIIIDTKSPSRDTLESLRTILDAVAAGANTVEAIGKAVKAGTNCGSCQPELRRLLP